MSCEFRLLNISMLPEEVKQLIDRKLLPESVVTFGDLMAWPIPEFGTSQFSSRIFEARTHLNIVAMRKEEGGTGAGVVPTTGEVWDSLKSLTFLEPVPLSSVLERCRRPKEKDLIVTASLSELAGASFEALSEVPWFKNKLRCIIFKGEMFEVDFDWNLLMSLLIKFERVIFCLPNCFVITPSILRLQGLNLTQLVRVIFISKNDLEDWETFKNDWYNWLGEEYCRYKLVVEDAHYAYYYYATIEKRVEELRKQKLLVESELRAIEEFKSGPLGAGNDSEQSEIGDESFTESSEIDRSSPGLTTEDLEDCFVAINVRSD